MILRRFFAVLICALWQQAASFAGQATDSDILTISIDSSITESRSRQVAAQISGIRAGVHTIVLLVDSDGGTLPDVFTIADALASTKATTVAYVRNVTASAIFIVASCDRIVSDEAGVIGGSEVVSRDYLILSDGLVAAIRGELTRKLKIYAEGKHHDAGIFMAMLDPEQPLIRDGRSWKESGQILSLTGKEMVAIRLAESKWPSLQPFIDDLRKRPKQAPEPTSLSVTYPACAGSAPGRLVAHL